MQTEEIVNDLFEEAQAEINDEVLKMYKREIKHKLTEKASAEQILRNINLELDELKLQIKMDLTNG